MISDLLLPVSKLRESLLTCVLENISACTTPTVLETNTRVTETNTRVTETNTRVTETSVVLLCGRAVTERRKSAGNRAVWSFCLTWIILYTSKLLVTFSLIWPLTFLIAGVVPTSPLKRIISVSLTCSEFSLGVDSCQRQKRFSNLNYSCREISLHDSTRR